jgi:hypothetical protein
MTMPPREKLGSVWVDTATLLVGDPCQFIREPGEAPLLDWDRYVELFDEQGTTHVVPALMREDVEVLPASERAIPATRVAIANRRGGTAGLAVVVGCDGFYPVFLERGEDGEPLRLIIELGGQVEP